MFTLGQPVNNCMCHISPLAGHVVDYVLCIDVDDPPVDATVLDVLQPALVLRVAARSMESRFAACHSNLTAAFASGGGNGNGTGNSAGGGDDDARRPLPHDWWLRLRTDAMFFGPVPPIPAAADAVYGHVYAGKAPRPYTWRIRQLLIVVKRRSSPDHSMMRCRPSGKADLFGWEWRCELTTFHVALTNILNGNSPECPVCPKERTGAKNELCTGEWAHPCLSITDQLAYIPAGFAAAYFAAPPSPFAPDWQPTKPDATTRAHRCKQWEDARLRNKVTKGHKNDWTMPPVGSRGHTLGAFGSVVTRSCEAVIFLPRDGVVPPLRSGGSTTASGRPARTCGRSDRSRSVAKFSL